ncbi:hypothetical protein RclHR1_18030002 [Rhizophagus clarus]|uniref:Uncharacterized protein n=1 Tax=Rhizophagus clarus TaxID=94130 RepID=A0A2Z6REQ3_9GLOM|nr:hypothetical protein RclHR1_18030002 [Rhizophagus clarus]
MTIESLFPNGTSGSFINDSNLQSFKVIKEQDGTRTLIGYFATWDALSRRLAKNQKWNQTDLAWCKHSTPSYRSTRQKPTATSSGPRSSSHKKAGSSPVVTGSNSTPLGSRKSRNSNNHENNTNSINLTQSQKLYGRSTSSNTNKGQRKYGNGHTGNINKVEIKQLLEQLISLCC